MEIYTVSLFGHRQVNDPFAVDRKLETIVRNLLAEKLNIPESHCFASWQELLAQPRMADCAFICTMDDDHTAPAVRAMELGYHLRAADLFHRRAAQAEVPASQNRFLHKTREPVRLC